MKLIQKQGTTLSTLTHIGTSNHEGSSPEYGIRYFICRFGNGDKTLIADMTEAFGPVLPKHIPDLLPVFEMSKASTTIIVTDSDINPMTVDYLPCRVKILPTHTDIYLSAHNHTVLHHRYRDRDGENTEDWFCPEIGLTSYAQQEREVESDYYGSYY